MYSRTFRSKIFLLIVALLIVMASVFYTNFVLKELTDREEEQVKMYAKELQFLLNSAAANEENNDLNTFLREMLQTNETIPLISVDSASGKITADRNIDFPKDISAPKRENLLRKELTIMQKEHLPIEVREDLSHTLTYIYFRNSYLLYQLRFFPYVQLTIICVFGLLVFLAFSYSQKAEQNRVWIGLAKETAHQLGTPISSLMAWVEYFKSDARFDDDPVIEELEKDISRLESITARFSNIGSVPTLKVENLAEVIQFTLVYLEKRISTKVKICFYDQTRQAVPVNINRPLFEWVVENICKNAVDAMSGTGELNLTMSLTKNQKVALDISDTGKGIPKNHFKRVFEAGFSTKKRGWGLGLTLARRIVESYHSGKVFVKHSEPGKGTTFRLLLNLASGTPANPALQPENGWAEEISSSV
jgi:two-component system, sporulation sensor kinase E